MASKVWVESIIAHLEVLSQTCGHVPAGERLEAQDLNKVLDLFDDARGKFIFVCELHGFKTQPKDKQ